MISLFAPKLITQLQRKLICAKILWDKRIVQLYFFTVTREAQSARPIILITAIESDNTVYTRGQRAVYSYASVYTLHI